MPQKALFLFPCILTLLAHPTHLTSQENIKNCDRNVSQHSLTTMAVATFLQDWDVELAVASFWNNIKQTLCRILTIFITPEG